MDPCRKDGEPAGDPPEFAERLLKMFCRTNQARVLGDLREEFKEVQVTLGKSSGQIWFWYRVLIEVTHLPGSVVIAAMMMAVTGARIGMRAVVIMAQSLLSTLTSVARLKDQVDALHQSPPLQDKMLLYCFLPKENHRAEVGDLDEEYVAERETCGKEIADNWYRKQVFKSITPYLVARIRRAFAWSPFRKLTD